MSQSVKLSDQLVLDARDHGRVMERSIAGQIEFWAGLGKAVEPLLRLHQVRALKRSGAPAALERILETVDTEEGHQRVRHYLESRPYPHFEDCPEEPGFLVKIEEDGTRTKGRFINRAFVSGS